MLESLVFYFGAGTLVLAFGAGVAGFPLSVLMPLPLSVQVSLVLCFFMLILLYSSDFGAGVVGSSVFGVELVDSSVLLPLVLPL